ncbi:MAG: 50S ribosomal protein L16 [Candidatus ainarchaeum sp.]|nr:50S ribosomal protein L16 [Candidatus ainarchaeum sp.]
MGLRPGRCYRSAKKKTKGDGPRGHGKGKKQKRPWTRLAIKVPKKNYIGAAPALRIRQFNMGNPQKKYEILVELRVREGLDLRDNALESVRMTINRNLVKLFGKDGFFMKVRVFPSNILRENKTAQGAGADRVSQGMSQSFGKPIGRSARVRANQKIYSILCMKSQEKSVRDLLMNVKSKFPCDILVTVSTDLKSIGTLPNKKSKDIEEVKVDAKEATTDAKDAKAGAKGKTPEKGKDDKKETSKPTAKPAAKTKK